jgi:dihydropteroate synthase
LARVIPVINGLAGKLKIPISIDSRSPSVVKKALESGASVVNLVGGLRDAEMAKIIAKASVPVILMHMQGEPDTMQQNPVYDDVMDDIIAELRGQAKMALDAGIESSNIILDPGIGFGKTAEQNLEIIKRLGEMRILGMPILIGTSRKSFIGKISGDANNRLEGSLASAVLASANGASIVRVHDVAETVRTLKLTDAIVRS